MRIVDYQYIHELGNKKKQEDYIWPDPLFISENNNCFIVCDGVGGSENGDIASKFVAEFVGSNLRESDFHKISNEYINELIQKARFELIKKADELGLAYDMATTLVMIIFVNDCAFVSWCGDSRIYHIRDGCILFRSADHSLVQLLVMKGEITEEEARTHPQKNVITKAIKADHPEINAEGEWITGIKKGDFFLLCSDGLLEMISDAELNEIFSLHINNPEKIRTEIYTKCLNKTRDNYSMSLLRIGISPEKENKFSILKFSLPILLIAAIILTIIFYPSLKPASEIIKFTKPVITADTNISESVLNTQDTTLNSNVDEENSILSFELITEDDGTIDTVWTKPLNPHPNQDSLKSQIP